MMPRLSITGWQRPYWASAGLSDEEVKNIQRYHPGVVNQQKRASHLSTLFQGSLAPQAPDAGDSAGGGLLPGTVTADMINAQNDRDPYSGMPIHHDVAYPGDTGKYVAPQTIPGTASNWTWQNPDPNLAARTGQTGTAPSAPATPTPVKQNAPWFQQPWIDGSQTSELPYWLKNLRT